jgi:autotransporter-associated beta strand protein
VLHGGCVFNVGGISLTITNTISGDGGVIKNGGSPMIFRSVNTYTGDTRINTGALRLSEDGSISTSSNITIAAGATLTVTGRVDATFTLVSGQTLKGNGTVNGKVVSGVGSTVSPGLDAIGALTVSNAVTLLGTNIMEVDEVNATNDVLRSSSTITYGGVLNLVNLGGPLSGASSFKLFNASSYLGSFSSINPATPGPGQTWDISALGTSGTLKVVNTSAPNLNFGVTNGVITFSWPSGYKLVWQTNSITKGLGTNWVDYPITSNPVNVTISPTIPTAFFALEPQ